MLKVGLTGGIGSGKTTVAKIFEVLGIPVYYADDAARQLTNEHPTIRKSVIDAFGSDAYTGDQLNRKYIAGIVFNDKEKLALLNSIVHPVTIAEGEAWANRQTTPYIIREAALIFESGVQRYLDYVIGVFAPVHLRIKRVMDRDQVAREEVQKRMLNQVNDEIKMKLCDFVIENNEQQLILPQVLALHKTLLEITAR